MAQEIDNAKFKMIFLFCCGVVALVFIYVGLVTFCPIPKDNLKYADMALPFLLASVVGGVIGYLIGGTASSSKKPDQQQGGSVTADISATITKQPDSPDTK